MSEAKLIELSSHEIEVLEMLNGEREPPWGAWVGVCLEFFSDYGFASRGCPYEITQKGREWLDARRAETGYWYLAGPYSAPKAIDRHRRFMTHQAALTRLLQSRIWVYSPITHCHAASVEFGLPTDAGFWQDYNHTMIDRARGLIVLDIDGLETSIGTQEEIEYARTMGLPIRFWAYPGPFLA